MRYLILQSMTPVGQTPAPAQALGHVEADSAPDALRRLASEADFRQLHLNTTWLCRAGTELHGGVLTESLELITWFSPIPEPWVAEYTARPYVEDVTRWSLDLLAPFAELVFLTPEQEQVEADDRATEHALATWANYVRHEVRPALRDEWAAVTPERLAHRLGLERARVQAALERLAARRAA
jgi:hypothetical protein